MFKKLLAKSGIGAATVDTRLYDDLLAPGEILNGEVHITGGNVSQEIEVFLEIGKRGRDFGSFLEEAFDRVVELSLDCSMVVK